ncbi:hypothetical protein WSM22_15550 [Cytophagales bacterium WSM2-2]|nr:hypothetical protein WSM22_15550 [Cytophagales bacterium WSM2-2]
MTLANPIFLWALTGLSIPVIIHLLSRKEGKIIRLGSIRHVVETSTQQFKGIRLNEILLLMLRSALIVIFSLLLSGLQCTGSRNQKWVVIEKDLRDTPLVKVAADSLSNSGFEIHLLARSFPDLQSDDSTFTSYGEIVESLKAKKLSEVVVFASNRMQRFNGPQVELPENIRWISVPFETKEYQLSAVDRGDSVILRTGFTGADETYFVNKRVAHNINASTPDTVKVLLVNDEAFSYDQKMVGAALKAIGMSFPVKLIVDMSTPSVVTNKKYDWCFWLSQKSMPSNISVNTVLLNPQASNEFLVQKKKHEWVFTKRLNEETSLSEELTLQLSKLIVPDEKLQAIARNYDRRSLPDSLVWSSVKSNYKEASVLSTPADRFLIICLLALLLAERIIAYQRKQ